MLADLLGLADAFATGIEAVQGSGPGAVSGGGEGGPDGKEGVEVVKRPYDTHLDVGATRAVLEEGRRKRRKRSGDGKERVCRSESESEDGGERDVLACIDFAAWWYVGMLFPCLRSTCMSSYQRLFIVLSFGFVCRCCVLVSCFVRKSRQLSNRPNSNIHLTISNFVL